MTFETSLRNDRFNKWSSELPCFLSAFWGRVVPNNEVYDLLDQFQNVISHYLEQ